MTVTDPDVTRFFMTLREAAELILQAGAMGSGGEIFILDITPVKIKDHHKVRYDNQVAFIPPTTSSPTKKRESQIDIHKQIVYT